MDYYGTGTSSSCPSPMKRSCVEFEPKASTNTGMYQFIIHIIYYIYIYIICIYYQTLFWCITYLNVVEQDHDYLQSLSRPTSFLDEVTNYIADFVVKKKKKFDTCHPFLIMADIKVDSTVFCDNNKPFDRW